MNLENQNLVSPEGQTSPAIDSAAAEEAAYERNIDTLLTSHNVAEHLEQSELDKIGQQCREGFLLDLESRKHWENELDEWVKLALQVREPKSFPWPKASNIKYPLLSTAAMQFNARAYPSLVPSNGKVVKAVVIGKDPDGSKREKAERISTYMSYQVMYQIEKWEEDTDKLLLMLPIVGCIFRKTFYDKATDRQRSYLVTPKNLVINNWARCIEEAERVSEIIEVQQRVFKERKNRKAYLDVDIEPTSWSPIDNTKSIPSDDSSVPYTLIEQHTFLDLDDDGYTEPYIVTFEVNSGTVVRIQARWTNKNVEKSPDGKKLIAIHPTVMYTKYSFVPNPDGSFYDIGFGSLLGPLNEAVNSVINQLVDSGTLNNLQSGYIGKGLKLKAGDNVLRPGEWKPVAAAAEDLRKQIVPLPAKEPSEVLFKLMGALITSGKELASVAEIFTGKMPGQNTPATTTMATVEQGMKVFTAVYKRIFRALTSEFKKLKELNATYLDPNTYSAIVDAAVSPDDFNDDNFDIEAGADPSAMSSSEKLMKAQGLLELLPTGILDPVKVVARVLEAQEQPNYEDLFVEAVKQTGSVPPRQDPKMMEMQMKGQLEQQKMQMQAAQQQQKMELEARDKQVQLAMKAQEHAQEQDHAQRMAQIQEAEAIHKQRIFSAQAQADMVQKLTQSEAEHQQKLTHAKEQASLQREKTSQTGKPTQSQKNTSNK